MPKHSEITPLLELQSIDQELTKAITRKKSIPADIQACLTRIAKLQDKLENGKTDLRQCEVARKQNQTDIEQAEEKILKLKTQQLSVKKNEEYQALNREMEMIREKIGALEESGLETLEKLDQLQAEVEVLQGNVGKEVEEVKGEIKALEGKEKELNTEITTLEARLKEQGTQVDETLLTHWKRLRKGTTRLPLVVSAKDKKCGGCYMRISNELESRLLTGDLQVFCDHCGRLLYTE